MFELESPKVADGEVAAIDERVELFSIDGKVYTVPDKVRPSLSLRYLYLCRTQGVGIAENWLAEQMLGTEAFIDLINWDHLKSDQYNQVIAAARAIALGEVRPKEIKGMNGNGHRGPTAAAKKRSTKPTT